MPKYIRGNCLGWLCLWRENTNNFQGRTEGEGGGAPLGHEKWGFEPMISQVKKLTYSSPDKVLITLNLVMEHKKGLKNVYPFESGALNFLCAPGAHWPRYVLDNFIGNNQCCHVWRFITNLATFATIWLPKIFFLVTCLFWLLFGYFFGYFWKFG